MKEKKKILLKLLCITLLLNLQILQPAFSDEDSWVVSDIRISGLQRVSAGSVFAEMPISVGDKVDIRTLQNIAKTLFKTGQFDDIQIGRDANILIISLVERPSIASINVEGNKAIKTEDLLRGLEGAGLSEGQVFKRSVVSNLALEIHRQYISQGRYGAQVDVKTNPQPRNRVELEIVIEEGEVATIEGINVVGNKSFSDEDLLRDFELSTGGWFSFLSSDNKYSREKLKGDLETLTSYYKDRGYVEFNLSSSQVSITPDKKSVYITLNIDEGKLYKVDRINLTGDIPVDADLLRSLVLIKEGDIYSQFLITETEELFINILGNEGYSFAEVNGVPDINEETGNVDLTFYVDPQQRTYVRRIIFKGNKRTHDVVLRREMRQMEGAWASNALIENSKLRLERLGFFKEVESESIPVAGIKDQVDVEFSVEEEVSGSIGGSFGYSSWGLMLGVNYSENNAFGTGKRVGLGINDSSWRKSYYFDYGDPYFTIDGVSRGYSVFYNESDYGQYNIASYTSDSYGTGIQFGLPISDIERIGLNLRYENTSIDVGAMSASQILSFTSSEGTDFEAFKTQLVWSRITLNRGIFPTSGQSQSFALELAIPGSSITYGRATYRHRYYRPIFGGRFILGLRGEIGVLEAYGDTNVPPFYEHFYSGGITSVRGFKANTLGPRATQSEFILDAEGNTVLDESGQAIFNPYYGYSRNDERSIGGAYLIEGGFDFIFRLPFLEDQRSVRTSFFIDTGNVFAQDCGKGGSNENCSELDVGELRYSYGLGVTWITQLGPMSLALATVGNEGPLDRTEGFQFEIGTQF